MYAFVDAIGYFLIADALVDEEENKEETKPGDEPDPDALQSPRETATATPTATATVSQPATTAEDEKVKQLEAQLAEAQRQEEALARAQSSQASASSVAPVPVQGDRGTSDNDWIVWRVLILRPVVPARQTAGAQGCAGGGDGRDPRLHSQGAQHRQQNTRIGGRAPAQSENFRYAD